MVQVHDLYRTGKLSVSDVPDPDGSVAEDDFFIGAAPAALPGFGIETATELLSRFNRSGVGSRSFITQGPSLLVNSGLCEHRAQFYLAGMGRCVAVLSLPPLGFSAHYRHARAIHLDIQNRNARAGHDGQIELEGAACSHFALASPIVSACRSTAFRVTARPASSSNCVRPRSNEVSLPTTAIMRRTPGE